VTHGTIEERIVQVMQQKRALFAGLFASDSDEVDFAALGQPTIVETMREMVGEAAAPALPDAGAARAKLAAASVQFIEALAELLAVEKPALAPDLAARTTKALDAIMSALNLENETE
jgi:site-specific recombinase